MESNRVFLRCLFLNFACILTFCNSPVVLAENPKVERLELMRHSFDSPLTYDTTLSEWIFGGASVATRSHVVVVPGVANRTGHVWHKAPMKTANFEINVQFRIEGPADGLSYGWALWYSYDDFAKIFPPLPDEAANWNLFGFKENFKGIAVFFAFHDRENKARSSVSFASNDGHNSIRMLSNVPTGDGVYYSPLRNTSEPLQFSLTVGPAGIRGRLKLLSSTDWLECFKVAESNIHAGGHIGFSASTPVGDSQNSDQKQAHKLFDKVVIENLHVYNLDVTMPGEDAAEAVADTLRGVEVGELLKNHEHQHGAPDSVATELQQLSRLVYKQIAEGLPRDTEMRKQLGTQTAMIQHLSMQIQELHKIVLSVPNVAGDKPPADVVNQFTNELQGLRNLFHSQTKHQENLQHSLSSLQRSIGAPTELSKIAEQSASLEATIKQQAALSSWMILTIIVMIALFALFMWKRMREMEKKHFL